MNVAPESEGVARCPTCHAPLSDAEALGCGRCGWTSPRRRGSDEAPAAVSGFLSLPEMRYPNAYHWLVLVSALDVVLTMLVIYVWGGYEVNPVARAVIKEMGFVGAIAFKFAVVVLVIILCEVIGRLDDRTGRTLAVGAVIISAVPVAYTFALLLRENWRPTPPEWEHLV